MVLLTLLLVLSSASAQTYYLRNPGDRVKIDVPAGMRLDVKYYRTLNSLLQERRKDGYYHMETSAVLMAVRKDNLPYTRVKRFFGRELPREKNIGSLYISNCIESIKVYSYPWFDGQKVVFKANGLAQRPEQANGSSSGRYAARRGGRVVAGRVSAGRAMPSSAPASRVVAGRTQHTGRAYTTSRAAGNARVVARVTPRVKAS